MAFWSAFTTLCSYLVTLSPMSILVKQKVLRWGLAPFTAGSMVSLNSFSTNWQINGHICFTVWGREKRKIMWEKELDRYKTSKSHSPKSFSPQPEVSHWALMHAAAGQASCFTADLVKNNYLASLCKRLCVCCTIPIQFKWQTMQRSVYFKLSLCLSYFRLSILTTAIEKLLPRLLCFCNYMCSYLHHLCPIWNPPDGQ